MTPRPLPSLLCFLITGMCLFAEIVRADSHPEPAYFSTLPFRETPFAPLIGTHPISPQEAETRNHYRFDFDQKGRPVRVAFMLGDAVRSLNDTANYYFQAPRIDIAYDGETETRTFFDSHGNRIAVRGAVASEVYDFDDRGYRRRMRFFNIDGEPVENAWGVARYEWVRMEDGTVAETRFDLEDAPVAMRPGLPFYEIRLHYGPGGWLALMQNFGTESRLTQNNLNAAQDRLDYRANGDLLAWNVLDLDGALSVGNGPGVARGRIDYDAHGYEIAEYYEDEKGNPITSGYGWSHSRARYDSFGNRIERANYTLDGSNLLINPQQGYAGYIAQFDESGRNMVLIAFYGENREPIAHARRGNHQRRMVYDDHGNRIRIRYEDEKGRLVNRADTGAAVIEYDYDARGRAVETRFLDAEGALVAAGPSGAAIIRRTFGAHGIAAQTRFIDAQGREIEG